MRPLDWITYVAFTNTVGIHYTDYGYGVYSLGTLPFEDKILKFTAEMDFDKPNGTKTTIKIDSNDSHNEKTNWIFYLYPTAVN